MADVYTEIQLGQLRPANTTAASIYSPAVSTTTWIKTILVCNTTTGSAKFRIFHDEDGTTYDETTALFWDIKVDAGRTEPILLPGPGAAMANSVGNFAVRTDTNDALTFTCYGVELTTV